MNDTAGDPDKVTFSHKGTTAEFNVLPATDGKDAVDFGSFTRQTGLTTLDQGFVNTAATRSAITYIDGDRGHPAVPGVPDRRSWPATRTFLEVSLPADLR